MKPESVICVRAGDLLCDPDCIHGRPHEPDGWAYPSEFKHLKKPTMRVCGDGQCCTRKIVVKCVITKEPS